MNRSIQAQADAIETVSNEDAATTESRDAVYEVLSVTNLNAAQGTDGSNQTVDVLYQRLGSRWYAFSMVGDEVYFTQVDASEAERRLLRQADSAAEDSAALDAAGTGRLFNGCA